jgi:hypothetical protein
VKLRGRLGERRRQKAHRRNLQERDRQRALSVQDAQEAVGNAARGSAAAQQGIYGS